MPPLSQAPTEKEEEDAHARPGEGATIRPAPRDHLLGAVGGELPGPLFFAVGGMHGNEPSGVVAIERVLARIAAESLPLRGRLVGIAGNLEALAVDERYLERDLNRMWSESELDALRADESRPEEDHEARARRAILEIIEREIEASSGEVHFLDLHSTSAAGSPFTIIGDTLRNRRIAFGVPAPVILGLEELVEGTLLGYFGERGHVAVGFEGGSHRDPLTVEHSEAALWLALISVGALPLNAVRGIAREMRARLERAGAGLPRFVEVRERHHVEASDEFEMRPGYTNFDSVARGEWLATDRDGRLFAGRKGRILLPLYQGQGQDGYFLGGRVSYAWLWLSALLRKLKLDGLMPLLPGVRRDRQVPGRLFVNRRIARFFPIELFHLFGYRRIVESGAELAFSRRVERPIPH